MIALLQGGQEHETIYLNLQTRVAAAGAEEPQDAPAPARDLEKIKL